MANILQLGLRAFQWFMALLVMALVGNMIASATGGNPSVVNYDMFCAVFAMLTLFYLTAIALNDSYMGHGLIPITLDLLNTIFWFCAAVAMAADLGVHSCGNSSYIKNNSITNGAHHKTKRCHEAQASTAFLWFGFAAFAASTFFSAMGARSSGVNLRAGGIRRGGPAMSQV